MEPNPDRGRDWIETECIRTLTLGTPHLPSLLLMSMSASRHLSQASRCLICHGSSPRGTSSRAETHEPGWQPCPLLPSWPPSPKRTYGLLQSLTDKYWTPKCRRRLPCCRARTRSPSTVALDLVWKASAMSPTKPPDPSMNASLKSGWSLLEPLSSPHPQGTQDIVCGREFQDFLFSVCACILNLDVFCGGSVRFDKILIVSLKDTFCLCCNRYFCGFIVLCMGQCLWWQICYIFIFLQEANTIKKNLIPKCH